MTEAEAMRLAELDAMVNDAMTRIFGNVPPLPPTRPYIPETVVTLLDGQRFIVACDSLMACAEYAEFIVTEGFRLASADGFSLWPAHQVKQVRVRKTAK